MVFSLMVVISLLSSAMAANSSSANTGQIIKVNNALLKQAEDLEKEASIATDETKIFNCNFDAAKIYSEIGDYGRSKNCIVHALELDHPNVSSEKKTILEVNKGHLETNDISQLNWSKVS